MIKILGDYKKVVMRRMKGMIEVLLVEYRVRLEDLFDVF